MLPPLGNVGKIGGKSANPAGWAWHSEKGLKKIHSANTKGLASPSNLMCEDRDISPGALMSPMSVPRAAEIQEGFREESET